MHNIKDIIESLLFVAEEPLPVDKIKAILETVETREIRCALDSLADQYSARGGGFFLSEVAGGWQLRSRPEFNAWIKRMLQPSPQRLTKAALETLAIVAYNQPIIRADIEHIRGVDCGGVLRQLMERKLIRVLGRKEIPGRPMIYATTKLFLELFNLKSLKDLPSPKEMEELGRSEEPPEYQPGPGNTPKDEPPWDTPAYSASDINDVEANDSRTSRNHQPYAKSGFAAPKPPAGSMGPERYAPRGVEIWSTPFTVSAAPHPLPAQHHAGSGLNVHPPPVSASRKQAVYSAFPGRQPKKT